jgi:regulator of replication initiation timing
MPPELETATETTSTTETASETAPETASSVPSESATSEGRDTSAAKTETPKATVKLPDSLKPPQKTGRFQQRISDLVQSRKTIEEENRKLKEQLSRFESVSRPGTTEAKPKAADPKAALSPDDFDTYGEYIQAVVDRTYEAKHEAEQSKRSEQTYEAYRKEKQTEFETHCQPLAEAYGEGFWDAITDPTLPVTEPMADAIMELGDMAPYVMLWLAANRDKAADLAKQNPRQTTIGIGRLAARLSAELEHGQGAAPPAPEPAPETTSQTFPFTRSASAPAAPRPTPVPTPRGSTPANTLETAPSDKDDIQTWLQKETNRIRRTNPNARFYGAS